jgi:DNA-binding CsgD family transcriptional regulator
MMKAKRNITVLRMRQRGMSYPEIAVQFGFSKQRAHQIALKQGAPLERHVPSRELMEIRNKKIMYMRMKNMTYREIGEHFGISTGNARVIAVKQGVPYRPRPRTTRR